MQSTEVIIFTELQSLLEPFSKLLSFVIQNAVFTLAYLVELCGLCHRAFTKVTALFHLKIGAAPPPPNIPHFHLLARLTLRQAL